MKNNFITEIIDKEISEGKYRPSEIYTRFPPEPNGFLHIGHAKAIYLSFEIAKKYGGKCNLRFDDTNPEKEEDIFEKSILKDIDFLEYVPEKICYASDYFEKFYECAMILIEEGLAYVDDSPYETIKEERGTLTSPGKNSKYRDRDVSENKQIFREMREGLYENGEKVLRAKIDMSSNNMNMRDPVLYRILHKEHHRTGDEWVIYPMYDFAHPLEDLFEGITHSLCTLEFEDHRPLYNWVLENVTKNMDVKYLPRQIEFARLNLEGVNLSKRYLAKLVEDNITDSWEDPRMPTISGLRRRGFLPSGIKAFIDEIGISKSNSTVSYEMLEHFVREDLKLKTKNKHTCFNPIKITLTNYPDDKKEEIEIENNPQNSDLGKRFLTFEKHLYIDEEDFKLDPPKKYFRLFLGQEVRLKGAYIIKCNEVVFDENNEVKELLCTFDEETKSGIGSSEKKVKGTIQWVSETDKTYITAKKFGENFSEKNISAIAEKSLLDENEPVQFFRKGFYVLDSFFEKENNNENPVYNEIVPQKSSYKIVI